MTTFYRQRQNLDRQRNEGAYIGHWGFAGSTKYKNPVEARSERRWYLALTIFLALVDVLILVKVALIAWQ